MDLQALLLEVEQHFGTSTWMWKEEREKINFACCLYDGQAGDWAQYYQKQMDRTDGIIIVPEYSYWKNFPFTIEHAFITTDKVLHAKQK